MQKSRRISLGVVLGLIGIAAVFWWQQVAIYDWIRLRDYQAPANVAVLADHTTMNGSTRRLFYVNRPAIEDKAHFNSDCTDSEQTIVLGCYVSGKGIFIYKIDDPRLEGVSEVTAAHEALHAAYQRLSSSERDRVDQMTAQAFTKVTDVRVKKTIEAYRSRDASVVPNELHSILGTEVRNLPSDLEQYYTKYFTNRAAIVDYSEKYEQAFTDRQNKVDQYESQLKGLKQQIDGVEASLNTLHDSLITQKAQMDAQLAANQIEEYNAQVSTYNSKVRQYNSLVTKDQGLIDLYNQIVAARNVIALEENQLVKAIDSRPTTVQTQ